MFKKILNFIDTKINFKVFDYFLISWLVILPVSLIFQKYNVTLIEQLVVFLGYSISIDFFEKAFLRNK